MIGRNRGRSFRPAKAHKFLELRDCIAVAKSDYEIECELANLWAHIGGIRNYPHGSIITYTDECSFMAKGAFVDCFLSVEALPILVFGHFNMIAGAVKKSPLIFCLGRFVEGSDQVDCIAL